MAGTVKGIIVEIGGDTSGLQKALNKINSVSSGLSKELRGINSLLKLDPSNTILVKQKQEALAESIQTTESKLKSLKDAQEQADDIIAKGGEINQENYRALQREIITTENKLNSLKAEASNWNKAGEVVAKFGERITGISEKVETLGTNLTTKITLPLVALAGVFANSAMEFETAFTGVEKTVDGTAEQMENLKKGIKDMSKELPSSTTEIAAVAEAAGQLGIHTDNILGFSKAMIDLGNSTNLTADEAATTLARFANVTKMSQSDFGKLGSVIVALGNNFATTEAEIADMGMNLASAGTQVGMSQSEIMALATALSSVGLEAQAGGTAFSKVMVNMQLAVEKGGAGLKDFAMVAGMSSKEFQKAFREDATGAIMKFVEGLSKSDERGKSAIKVLDDMEIKETRLRDALLRSANASNIMSEAIEVGTKAWDENTALTNEANKRYNTLVSKVQMTKNKLSNLATNMGNKLTPAVSKTLDKINGLADKFENLTEEETLAIVKTAGFVAAVGPALTIVGKLGTKLGSGITTLGNFSKAIANVRNDVKVAEGQVGTFTKILGAMASPVGLATIAIGALTTATVLYAKKQAEEIYGLDGVTSSIDSQQKSWQKLKEAREEQLSNSAIEINNLQNLKDELSKITDENGKVKEGYKDRANYIVTELSEALGEEISLNGDVIDKYQEVQSEIQKLIEKKKAEALLSAYANEYAEAMKNQSKATENLVSLKKQLQEKTTDLINATGREKAELELSIAAISNKIKEESEQISQYGYTIQNYENLQTASVSNSEEAIRQATEKMGVSWGTVKEQASQSLQEQIVSQQEYVTALKLSLQDAEVANDEYQAYILQKQLDSANERLTNLQKELSSTATTIDTDTAIQSAIDNLGNGSLELYKGDIGQFKSITGEELNLTAGVVNNNKGVISGAGTLAQRKTSEFSKNSKIAEKADEEIRETAGLINNYKGMEIAGGNKGEELTTKFDNNNNISQKMQEEIVKTANVLNTDTSVKAGGEREANEVNTGFNGNVNGHKWGSDLTENISSGIISKIASVASAAARVAGTIASYLHHSVPDKGPLADELEYMPDMIDNLTKTLLKSSPKLEKASLDVAQKMASNLDLSKYQSVLSAKVIDSTKTVFTTPQIVFNVQELDEAKLQQCFNYINKKFGSAY